MDNESTKSGAALAASACRSKHATFHGQVEVRVVHDDGGVVTSELENSLSESSCHLLSDNAPYLGGASEADERNALVLHYKFANVAVSLQQDEDSLWHLALAEHLYDDASCGN